MDKPLYRKKFITNDRAQLKILSILLISILVPVFFVGSFLYLTIFKILSDQPSVPGFIPVALDPVIAKTNLAIMMGFVPILLLLFIWGVIVSNRLTGPLQRLQKELDTMAKSGVMTRLSVRKYDYIKSLASSINKLLTK